MFSRPFVILAHAFIFLYLTTLCFCQDKCVTKDSCSCQYANGSMIDLSSLGRKDNVARFLDQVVDAGSPNFTEEFVYSYNPCYSFTEGASEGCKNVAVCQKKKNPETFYNLGSQTSAVFYYYGSDLMLNYSNDVRTTSIKLVCAPGETLFTVIGETILLNYSFTLQSVCACPDGCATAPADKLSTGSVLVILLFICILCYIVGGVIFQKIIKGATGKELFPNYEFWMDFPLLVRDGVVFSCNGCQNDVSYDRI